MLRSVFGAETCAKCRNCCVFEPQSAWELPTFSAVSVLRLSDVQAEAEGTRYRITLPYDETGDAKPCPFLDPDSGCTLPAEEKPFACSIWPLRVMRKADGEIVFAVYQGCPGVPEEKLPQLEQLLENGLKTRIYEEVGKDSSLILPYHPKYRILHTKFDSGMLP
ncbi:MAG: hypothetical protein MJ062_03985 [Oscillospiraceae bacterium]|nr:hypothetical protein [Oscillospiraceae bacterium]